MSNRLVLGTAQFGLNYGVANQTGQVSRGEAEMILDHAWATGLDTLDTAVGYGQSEQTLGEIGVRQWHVISKLPALPNNASVAEWVEESVRESLGRLGIPKLYGLLLHRSQELTEPLGAALYQALRNLKDEGKVDKIGVSVYGPDELDALWPRYQLDLVQAPFNIVDRRLATSGWLERLDRSGTEVYIRSIFLQGLLLMDPLKRPSAFRRWQRLWDRWDQWLDEEALTPLQACVAFAMSRPEVDRAVIGVNDLDQLKEILGCVATDLVEPPAALISKDLELINPSCWKSL